MSEDPSEYVGALERGLYFESVRLTAEDRQRQEQYRIERERAGQQTAFATTEDYLRSLEMVGTIAPVDDTNLARVVQLLGKTNQFNLTTRRHSAEDVQAMLADPRSVALTFSMADRFGDYGLIAVVLGVPEGRDPAGTLRIDTWLMSCRVIGRTTEEFIFNAMRTEAQRLNYTTILGEYIPTSKNRLVHGLYDRLGFPGTVNLGRPYNVPKRHRQTAQSNNICRGGASSMSGSLIDLTNYRFWVVVLIAYVALTLCPGGKHRRRFWAVVNLGFIFMLWARAGVAALIGLLIVYGLLYAVSRMEKARLLLLVIAAMGGAGFVVHKLPELAAQWNLPSYTRIAALVGLSFVVLRLVEVFRAVAEKRHPVPDFPSLVNYVFPFHMLAAGPIQSYEDFVSQPEEPAPLTRSDVLLAVERITQGMFKKYVLALLLQKVALNDFSTGGIYFWIEVQIFFLWLYLDFSAYSDVAVGVGRLIGVATPENFNRPYLARNVIDFWERWHISLSQFVRRNLFIPLQMYQMRRWENVSPVLCASIAFTISFLLCGVWHGLTWSFVMWGAIHALGLVIVNSYRLYLQRKLGGKGVRQYLEIRWVKWLATFATYEFVALSLVPLFL